MRIKGLSSKKIRGNFMGVTFNENFDIDLQEVSFPATDELKKKTNTEKDEKTTLISELSIQGYKKIKENNIGDAKEYFKRILELDENNNYALVGLGDSARKQGNFIESINCYNECLKYHPENSYALFGLADCYKAMNQFSKAIDIWEEYLKHDNTNITVLTRIADAYRKIHDFKKSKDIYLKVLESEDDNAYALIGIGHLYYDFKNYNEALKYWTKMYDLHKEHVDIRILTSIGNCHRKLKTFSGGIPYFEKALELDPDNFYALFGLADCYRGMNLQHKSIEYWNRILKIDPENKVILTRIGDAYRNTGDYKKAEEYYTRALDIDFDIYAAMGLALLCKCEEKYDEAISRFKNLIRNDQKNYRLYIDLADCYLKTNKKEKAIKTLESFRLLGLHSSAVNELIDNIKA